MIRLLADENIAGLDALPPSSVSVSTLPGRSIQAHSLDGIDALWVRSVTQVDKNLLAKARVSYVGTATAGLEHIDRDYLESTGTHFCAAPGSNANAVVEYVLAALLELGKPWQTLEQGERLGIVGYGHVGKRLKSVADKLGWRVSLYDPPVAAEVAAGVAAKGEESPAFCSLDELLSCAVISVHCSLTHGVAHPSFRLFDENVWSCLDAHQTLINASRGEVFDWSALRQHLATDSPANLVLDVWENEPGIDATVLQASAVKIATPHIAGYSLDAKLEATRMLWEGMGNVGMVPPIPLSFDQSSEPQPNEQIAPTQSANELIQRYYRIRDDDQEMRSRLLEPRSDVGPAFDSLRRNYPLRRELAKLEVSLFDRHRSSSLAGEALRLCEALR